MNVDTSIPTGGPEQPSTSAPGAASGDEQEGEAQPTQPTQAAATVEEDEGDPTQHMSPPIPLDRLVSSLCGESTDGASP